MSRVPLLPAELQAYVADRYLTAGIPARELVVELSEKFGQTVSPSALRQFITRHGLAKRRKQLDAQTCSLVSSAKVTALAREKAAQPAEHLARFADKARVIADKTLDQAISAGRIKDTASAVAAASTAVRMYQNAAGLNPGGGARVSFNYNFANCDPMTGRPFRSGVESPAEKTVVEINVTPAT